MSLNRQKVFNKAYLGLKAQSFRQAKRPDNSCVYRTAEGLKCAVGQLLPDDFPLATSNGVVLPGQIVNSQAVESMGPRTMDTLVKGINICLGLPDEGFNADDHDFLISLQYAHDNADADSIHVMLAAAPAETAISMENRLKHLALSYGLTVPLS